MIKRVTVTRAQGKIMASKKRFRIVNAGRRFGKSFLAGYEMLGQALNKPGSIIWYIAPTLPMARKIMWDGWLRRNVPKEYISKMNQQMMVMEFKNGSVIYCLTADDPDSLRGTGIDLMVIDEAAMITANDFWETIRPNLADKHHDGRCLIISTPKGYNWFYDRFQAAKTDPAWDYFQFTTIEGENVDPEEIEEAKRTMTKKMFEQEFLASFETMSNRVYYNFDRTLNSIDGLEWFGKEGDVHVGIDFNVNPMTASCNVLLRNKKKELIAIEFDEIVEPNSDTQDLSNKLKERFKGCTIYVYPDPTCHKRQTNAVGGVSDYDILQKNGFIVCCPSHPYASKDKWNTVNTALCDAAGTRHAFIVKDSCPATRKALEGYCYKESNKTEPDKSSGLDHISDAYAYFICYTLPMKARRITRPQVTGV